MSNTAAEVDLWLDLGNPVAKERMHAFVDGAEGMHHVRIKKSEMTRRQRANAKYWAGWVTPLADYLREQDATLSKEEAKDEAHDEMVKAVLGVIRRVSPITGKVKERRKPTHNLSVRDFNDYMDRAAVWLAQMGIFVQDERPTVSGGVR